MKKILVLIIVILIFGCESELKLKISNINIVDSVNCKDTTTVKSLDNIVITPIGSSDLGEYLITGHIPFYLYKADEYFNTMLLISAKEYMKECYQDSTYYEEFKRSNEFSAYFKWGWKHGDPTFQGYVEFLEKKILEH